MTTRIRDFLRNRRDDGPLPRRRPRRRARQLPDLRQGAARTRRVFYAVKANPAPEVLRAAGLARLLLRHRLGRRDRDGARGRRARRTASPSATPSRRSATSRAPTRSACASSRSTARPRSRRSRRAAPGSKVFCRIPVRLRRAPNGRCRASSAASRRWPSTCWSTRTALGLEALWRVVPRRLAAAQPACLGPGARVGGGDVPRVRASAASTSSMVNLGGGFPTKYLKNVPTVKTYGAVDLPRAAQALRQPHPGDHHRAGPRHGRQCRRDRGRGRAGLEEERERRRALGLSRHRQVRRPRRDDGRVDPLPDPHAARRRRAGALRAGRVRPATRRTCCTRRSRIALPVSLEIGDKVLIEGTGAYTATYSAVAFNGFAPLKTYHI